MNMRVTLCVAAVAVVVSGCTSAAPVATDAAARPRTTHRTTTSTDVERTSSSPRVRPTTTTEPTIATTTSIAATTAPVTTIADAGCDTTVDLVRSAAAVRSLDTAAEQLDALGAAVDAARPRLGEAGPTTRPFVEQLVLALSEWRTAGVDIRAEADRIGDLGIAMLTDQLIVQAHAAVLNPLAFPRSFEAIDACPALLEVGTAADAAGPDPMVDIRTTRDALVSAGHAEIADHYLPEGWLDLTDRDMTVALSGMQAEYDRCVVDPVAAAYGDNSGCDALHDACDARNLLACNDLYWASAPGSTYEQFASTCGERVAFGSPASAGYCELLN